jgi:signal peptidase II
MSKQLDLRDAAGSGPQAMESRKTLLYGGMTAGIITLDQVTKVIVQQVLLPYQPVQVLGDYFRLTYIYNPGAAFGLHVGPFSRYVFLALTIACVIILAAWFRSTPVSDRLRLVAISLVTAGAIGNFIDRVRSARGVIDFLDLGVGTLRWPVFNVADIGVTIGAVLLAISLWREEEVTKADER